MGNEKSCEARILTTSHIPDSEHHNHQHPGDGVGGQVTVPSLETRRTTWGWACGPRSSQPLIPATGAGCRLLAAGCGHPATSWLRARQEAWGPGLGSLADPPRGPKSVVQIRLSVRGLEGPSVTPLGSKLQWAPEASHRGNA